MRRPVYVGNFAWCGTPRTLPPKKKNSPNKGADTLREERKNNLTVMNCSIREFLR